MLQQKYDVHCTKCGAESGFPMDRDAAERARENLSGMKCGGCGYPGRPAVVHVEAGESP